MKIKLYENSMLKSVFSVFVAFIPIMSIYYSGIPGVNAADVILGIFLAFMGIYFLFLPNMMADHLRSMDFGFIAVLTFLSYVFMHAAVAMYVHKHDQSIDVVIRSTRIIFYLLSSIVLLPKLLDTHMFIKAAKVVSVLASLFLLIQVFVYTESGIVIRGFPSFLPLYSSEYLIFDYENFYSLQYHRPTSFFLEPAHYSRYAAMVLPLFMKDYFSGKNKWLTISATALLTGSILLSTSSIGMLLAGVSWFFFIFEKVKKYYRKKKTKILILSAAVMLALIAALVVFVPSIKFTVIRSTNFSINSAFQARLGSLKYLFSGDNGILNLIFGNGYGNVPGSGVWMTDIMYILYGTGFLGTSCIMFYYLKILLYKCNSLLYKATVFITLLLLFIDDSFNSSIIVFILSIHYCSLERQMT